MFWKRSDNKRIDFEDALKHIYNCEYRNVRASTLSLAGALNFGGKKTVALIEQMEGRGLIRVTGDGLELTPHGRAWAIQVVRAHRLWESYLSDQVGVPLEHIHEKAEQEEHNITPAQADKLEADLGYPTRDPHGDPIPSRHYKPKHGDTIPLVDWPIGKLARIVHIEDEPPAIFTQILAEGLLVDTCIKILKSEDRGLYLWTYDHEFWLAPIIAANISVESAPDWVEERDAHSLSILKPGERGRVLALKSQGLTRRRFMDLGIVPGTLIEAVMPSAFGEPLAYKVRNTMIALRKEQAQQILIQRHKPDEQS